MNPDTIGCVWTGEFDLNTLRVDGEIFESGKKKLRIRKYPDTCGRGLSVGFVKFVLNAVAWYNKLFVYCIVLEISQQKRKICY